MANKLTIDLLAPPALTKFHLSSLQHRAAQWFSDMNAHKDTTVLEVGCGNGNLSAWLLASNVSLTSIVHTQKMYSNAVEHCRCRGFDCPETFRISSLYDVDYPDSSFDVIIALNALDYFDFDRWLIQDFWRMLRPGGRLIVSTAEKFTPRSVTRPWVTMGWQLSRRLLRGISDVSLRSRIEQSLPQGTIIGQRMYSRNEMRDLLKNNLFSPDDQCLVEAGSSMEPNRLLFNCRKIDDEYRAPTATALTLNTVAQIVNEENAGLFERLTKWCLNSPLPLSNQSLLTAEDVLATRSRWLVLSPHPDDEVIGCGGTLLKATAQKKDVIVLQMTNGAASSALFGMPEHIKNSIRLKEAATVAQKLKCHLQYFGESDGSLSLSAATANRLSRILEEARPDVIFVPFINDSHTDHIATNKILCAALQLFCPQPAPLVVSYEVWSLVPGNTISKIDEHLEQKCRLLLDYRTPMRVKDYVRYSRNLNALHALELTGKPGFAELFYTLNTHDYCDLVERSTCM